MPVWFVWLCQEEGGSQGGMDGGREGGREEEGVREGGREGGREDEGVRRSERHDLLLHFEGLHHTDKTTRD